MTKSTESANILSLRVGDCVPEVPTGAVVRNTDIVACSKPHKGEVFDSLTATGGDEFPGVPEMEKQSEGCKERFASFIGKDFDSSALEMSFLYPVAQSWTQGDREILCIVVDPAGGVTGSLKGANR